MKFSCEKCQTRYSIGDEKVRGKVLKIRCKTCGNIVVVREQTATSQAAMPELVAASAGGATTTAPAPLQAQAQAQAQARPAPAAPGFSPQAQRPVVDVDWYVAIKGKQHGPAKKDEIVRLFREGKITDRSYLWNEGMAAWTRLREVPEFAGVLTGDTSPRRVPPPPPSEEQNQGAEIIPFNEAKRAREAQAPHDPFAAVTARGGDIGPVTNDPFAAVGGSSPSGNHAPRDSTRVFIMQAGLHNREKKHKRYAYAAGVAVVLLGTALYLDFKEIIAIPGLHSVVNVVTQREAKPPPIEMASTDAWDTAEEDPKLKCKLMPNPEKCVKDTMALNDLRRARKKAKTAKVDPTLDASNFNTSGPGADPSLRAAVGTGVGGTADISDQNEAARIKAVFANDGKKLTVPKPRIEPVAISGSDIDAEAVFKTIAQNNESIRACVEEGAKVGNVPQGRQVLVIGIEPNGKVSKTSFKDGPTSASPVGECIRGAAKRWKFQAFPGPAADVEVPLILSVGM